MSGEGYSTLLEEALEAWSYVRSGVIDEVENIPADRLDFRPEDETRSVRELVRHIAASGLMMSGELTRPDGDFTRQAFPDFIREYASHVDEHETRGELVELLRTSHDEGARKIREAGELHMLQHIRRFDGEEGTRLAWMHHGISHEMYHRGQLTVYARLLGRVPALTRRIRGG